MFLHTEAIPSPLKIRPLGGCNSPWVCMYVHVFLYVCDFTGAYKPAATRVKHHSLPFICVQRVEPHLFPWKNLERGEENTQKTTLLKARICCMSSRFQTRSHLDFPAEGAGVQEAMVGGHGEGSICVDGDMETAFTVQWQACCQPEC